MQPRLFDELDAHHQVIVEKLSRVFLIVADPAHYCRQMNHQIRLRVIQHPDDAVLFN